MKVVIPYADRLGEQMPTSDVRIRRAFPHLLAMISAITLLHQRQREIDGNGALLATKDDYVIALHLLPASMNRALGVGPGQSARRLWERLSSQFPDEFTVSEIMARNSESKATISGHLNELARYDWVEKVEIGGGQKATKWKCRLREHIVESEILPPVEKVFPDSTPSGEHNTQPIGK